MAPGPADPGAGVEAIWYWLLVGIYVTGIVFALEAVMKARTSQAAIAWSLALITFPIVSVVAYLFLGRNKFLGMVEAYEENSVDLDKLQAQIREALAPCAAPPSGLGDVRRAMRAATGMDVVADNAVTLLVDGEATFASILDGIAEAQDYVLVQFYTIRDDHLGRRLQEALIERARAGVRVKVLYDDIGSISLPRRWCRELEAAGAETYSFGPDRGRRNRFQHNFRNHRKIVVVDGRSGWVGGLNVGDEYLGLDPKLSPWRDTHLRVEGPMATQLQRVFFSDWYWAAREIPELEWRPQAATGDRLVPGMILPFSPSQAHETATLYFVSLLNLAKERAWISAPYFVPDEAVMNALKLAALRGVDVRIITTGVSDSLPVYFAAFHYIMRLRGVDIRFYAFRPGFLHEKAMLVDDRIASIGTVNFDERSFHLNFEVTALVLDERFASEVEATFEHTMARCEPIDPKELAERSLPWRFTVSFFRLLAPIL